jgi:uncharacterized protein
MYQASAPVFIRMLSNLITLIDMAQAHADARKFDSANYLGLRLAPDMLPFTKQIHIATDAAKFGLARLAGVDAPKYEDKEVTLGELKARVESVIAYLNTFKPEQIDGTETKQITLKLGPKQDRIVELTGQNYLLNFAMPNFYFHVTTAYALLRASGVAIGKNDFLGRS